MIVRKHTLLSAGFLCFLVSCMAGDRRLMELSDTQVAARRHIVQKLGTAVLPHLYERWVVRQWNFEEGTESETTVTSTTNEFQRIQRLPTGYLLSYYNTWLLNRWCSYYATEKVTQYGTVTHELTADDKNELRLRLLQIIDFLGGNHIAEVDSPGYYLSFLDDGSEHFAYLSEQATPNSTQEKLTHTDTRFKLISAIYLIDLANEIARTMPAELLEDLKNYKNVEVKILDLSNELKKSEYDSEQALLNSSVVRAKINSLLDYGIRTINEFQDKHVGSWSKALRFKEKWLDPGIVKKKDLENLPLKLSAIGDLLDKRIEFPQSLDEAAEITDLISMANELIPKFTDNFEVEVELYRQQVSPIAVIQNEEDRIASFCQMNEAYTLEFEQEFVPEAEAIHARLNKYTFRGLELLEDSEAQEFLPAQSTGYGTSE